MRFVILRNMLPITSKSWQSKHQLRWRYRLLRMLPKKKRLSIAKSKIALRQRRTSVNGSNIKSLTGAKFAR
jgi:hypothetical protein